MNKTALQIAYQRRLNGNNLNNISKSIQTIELHILIRLQEVKHQKINNNNESQHIPMNNLILLKQSPNKNQHNFEDNIEKFPVLSVFSVIENQLTIGLFLEISETFMGIFILL